MRKLSVFVALLVFLLSVWALPAPAAESNAEIEQLKEEVQKLLKRIEELEKGQAETRARTAEAEKKSAETEARSFASGLGLVSVNGGTDNAIEDNLQEYTVGLNYYLYGHNLKLSVDYSYLMRELTPTPTATVPVDDQHDNRFRTMAQFYF